MSQDIRVPDLGGDVTQITLASWLKQPGDRVETGEVVAEVMTDKVNAEIEAPVAGVLEALLVAEGADVTVDQPIARIAVSDSERPSARKEA